LTRTVYTEGWEDRQIVLSKLHHKKQDGVFYLRDPTIVWGGHGNGMMERKESRQDSDIFLLDESNNSSLLEWQKTGEHSYYDDLGHFNSLD